MLATIIECAEIYKDLETTKWKYLKRFFVVGKCVPKARPRFGGGHSYLPKRYRECKEHFIIQFADQAGEDWNPPSHCRIEFDLIGNFRGDADNIIGTYLDAMVQAGTITDDRINIVSTGSWERHKIRIKVPFAAITLYVPR